LPGFILYFKGCLVRLDLLLTKQNPNITRSKAEQLIKNNRIVVNGKIISKPSTKILDDAIVEILDNIIYVSRSAEKLKLFLNSLHISLRDFNCIDAGASTGGFTQVLLENDVAKIYAVDVGSSQLHSTLLGHEKVISIENCDIRDFTCIENIDIVVCDLSFISIFLVLAKLISLTSRYLLVLFKPQFEVGKNIKRNSRGVVKDSVAIENSIRNFETLAFSHGLHLIKKNKSLVKGKNGNEEYFYLFEK